MLALVWRIYATIDGKKVCVGTVEAVTKEEAEAKARSKYFRQKFVENLPEEWEPFAHV